jgi:hypothetical protein
VPARLDDGRSQKDVLSGDYYLYATYLGGKRIEAVTKFFVLGPVVLNPSSGRIGEVTIVSGSGLKPNDSVNVYFSSNRAAVGATIGREVSVYQNVGMAPVGADGRLGGGLAFQIPLRLTDGRLGEDVHGGDYYVYTTYYLTRTRIETITRFVVLDGEIRLEPQEGPVGTELKITGQGLRSSQPISISYDGDLAIAKSGDTVTDGEGKFSCTVIIPDSTSGGHAIVVSDVTGNKPEAFFVVKPKISAAADSAAVNQVLGISGNGFGEVQEIAISVNGERVGTTPAIITTNRRGTFSGGFRVPPPAGAATVEVADKVGTRAQAKLTIVTSPTTAASIGISPSTSLASPGRVGMRLTVDGTGFKPGGAIAVSFGAKAVASQTASPKGDFTATFDVPASPAGEYTVSASDGSNITSAAFVLGAPPSPVPVDLGVASGAGASTRFDWSDVGEASGVTYTLQLATDLGFTTTVLERTGLKTSDYALGADEREGLGDVQTAYYWRVKAIDVAGNESDWTTPLLFYTGRTGSPMPPWTVAAIGLGVVVVALGGLWLWKTIAGSRR